MNNPESGVSIGFKDKESEEIWKRGEKKHEEWMRKRREQLRGAKERAEEEGKEPFSLERFSKVYPGSLPGIKIMKSTPRDVEDYEMEYYLGNPGIKTLKDFANWRKEMDTYLS